MISNPLEDPFYYLKNFDHVLSWISARYDDVLTVEEQQFIAEFGQLPNASQALWVRMVMRKGQHFRASKLSYPEIGDTCQAAAPLLGVGWLSDQAPLALPEVFEVLSKPEIQARFSLHIARPKAKKDQWLEDLTPQFPHVQSLSEWYPALAERLYSLTHRALCDRLRLMFFGNLSQSWADLVLADLGLFTYEKVAFSPQSRALACREDIEGYLHLYRCREQFEAGVDVIEVLPHVLGYSVQNPWLQRRRARLLFQLGQHCERAGELTQALQIYRHSRHPEARVRTIRVLERLGEASEALALAEAAEQAPCTDAEHQQLLRMLPRLRRTLGLAALAKTKPRSYERLDLVLPPDAATSVEYKVASHLHGPEQPVHYVENTLINGLFGLLCWSAIFAPLPGAFFHPYQSGPADLLDEDFYLRRAELFDACLQQLEDDRYRDTIQTAYAAKFGMQSPFVAWHCLTQSLLDEAMPGSVATLNSGMMDILLELGANVTGRPTIT